MTPISVIKRRHIPVLIILCSIILGCYVILSYAFDVEHTHIIFQDDFESGNVDKWIIEIPPDAQPEESVCAILLDEGSNVLSEKGAIWAFAGDFKWTDYTYEVKVKFLNLGSGIHINFRTGIPGPRYFLGVWRELIIFTKEYSDTFMEIEQVEVDFKVDKWYTVKTVCSGNEFWVYVDDVLKFHIVDGDNPILSGRIGVECAPDSHIYFDDVKVYSTHELYVSILLQQAEDAINNARMKEFDTKKTEEKLSQAQAAYDEGQLSLAEELAEEVIEAVINAEKAQPFEPQTSPSTLSKDSSSPPMTPTGITWSIELITGVFSIGATIVGVGAWMFRTRNVKRKGRILVKRFMSEVDDIYSRFKMNSIRCELELLRLKNDVLNEFKEGIIDEQNFKILDERIDNYLSEVREELHKQDQKQK